MEIGEFADHIFQELGQKPAQLTPEDMDDLERWWLKTTRSRRCSLVMSTKPWSWLAGQVRDDRDFAGTVAATQLCCKDVIEACCESRMCQSVDADGAVRP